MSNTISDPYAEAIVVNNTLSPEVKNNNISTSSTYSGFNGIVIVNSNGTPEVTHNSILTTFTDVGYGVYIGTVDADSLFPGLVANNMIQIQATSSGTTLSCGLLNNESINMNYYFNSIQMTGSSANATSMCLYDATVNTSKNIRIIDNIFSNEAGGYVYYVTGVDSSKFVNDYNNLYYPIGNTFAYLGTAVSSFSDWKTKSGGEMNSYTYNPYFASATDLHTTNNILNATGIPIAGITDDIDGDTRNVTTPDIGADEFDPSPYDVIQK